MAWANAGGEALLRAGDGLSLVRGRLVCSRHEDTLTLARLIESAANGGRPATEAALRVVRPGSLEPLPVLVAPLLPGAARLLGAAAAARVLVVAGHPRERAVDPRLLQRLYGLKPSEAQLAAALLAGETLESYAGRVGLSPQTVRSYLKEVFAATGTHRQSELVLLLANGPLRLSN